MTEGAASPVRFVRVVGWFFLVAGVLGLLVSSAQAVVLSQAAPGLAGDGAARALPLAFAAASIALVVVSAEFLRRRRWARATLTAITALGIVASLGRLLLPVPASERPPPDAPAEYLRLLQLISIADVVVPLGVCLVLGWVLWRLRSPAVRQLFQ